MNRAQKRDALIREATERSDRERVDSGYGLGRRYNAIAMQTECSQCGHIESDVTPLYEGCPCCVDAVQHLRQQQREHEAAEYRIGLDFPGIVHDDAGRVSNE